MVKEEWKDIIGYEGLYQISNHGRVKSLERKDKGNRYIIKEKILKNTFNQWGYYCINLYDKNSCPKVWIVHRLVALHFINNPNNYPHINHINGIKNDNYIENLEWCTPAHNVQHSYKLGLQKSQKGEDNSRSKLLEKEVIEIRQLLKEKKLTQNEIAKIYNISYITISDIKRKKSWKHIEEKSND